MFFHVASVVSLNTPSGRSAWIETKLWYTEMRTLYCAPYIRTLALCNSVYGFEMSLL